MNPTSTIQVGDASDEDILRELKAASAGLSYPSESEAPFDVFRWDSTANDALKQIPVGGDGDATVVETSVGDFFADLIAGDDAEQFARLRKTVESRLKAPRVLRIGRIEVQVYLVGKTPAGSWMGLHTTSVET